MFFENIKTAWDILWRNKVRSFLTMLGIIIGVMSMIVILAVGAGAQSLIVNQVKSLGSNLVAVLPGKSESTGPPAAAFGVVITSLTYDDGKALVNGDFPDLVAMAAYVQSADTITWQENQADTSILGTSFTYLNVEEAKVAQGRFFDEDDEKSYARVVVLGSGTAKDLFGDSSPLGQQIKIKKTNFTIIGVMQSRGTSGFQNQDKQIFVPVTTAQKLLVGINYVNFLRLKVDKPEAVNPSLEYIATKLRERHNITNPDYDDFSVRSTAQGLDALTNITNALRFFLAAIAMISLLVGGIGIMNIMLAAVQERTKEIGLRKALGAKNKQITRQFLVETIFITLVGGIIGIILGSLIAIAVAAIARGMGYSWDLVISPFSIFLGCAVSVSIGLIFGISPARRASRLNPIEALRYE